VTAEQAFAAFASRSAKLAGHPHVFLGAIVIVLVWGATGPAFRYSDTWQLVINTGTTIVTFLMVFVIQNSQNRDGAAIQAKLDALILANEAVSNRLIGLERRPASEIEAAARGVRTQTAEGGYP
jgi:low affinity Fe/Cu permease